jgi:hypothetical protein
LATLWRTLWPQTFVNKNYRQQAYGATLPRTWIHVTGYPQEVKNYGDRIPLRVALGRIKYCLSQIVRDSMMSDLLLASSCRLRRGVNWSSQVHATQQELSVNQVTRETKDVI